MEGGFGEVVEAVPVGVSIEDAIRDKAIEFFFE